MAKCIIKNSGFSPLTLPFPLRGILAPGKAVRVSLSATEVAGYFGGEEKLDRNIVEVIAQEDVAHPDDDEFYVEKLTANAAYPKTTAGVQTLAQPSLSTRRVVLQITVTEVFADGDGAQPVFEFGETGSDNKFDDGTLLVGAAAGATFMLQGELSADAALIVTATAATGSTSTGAIEVTATMLP